MPTTVIPARSENQYVALTDAGYAALTLVHDPETAGSFLWEIETSFTGDRTRLDYTAATRPRAFERLNELVARHLRGERSHPAPDARPDAKRPYREGPARAGRRTSR